MASVPPVAVLLAAWLAATGASHSPPVRVPQHKSTSHATTIPWATSTEARTETDTSEAPTTTTTDPGVNFDIDLHQIFRVWFVTRFSSPPSSALTNCIYATPTFPPVHNDRIVFNLRRYFFEEQYTCEKKSTGLLECFKTGSQPFSVVALGTNYATYLVIGVFDSVVVKNRYAARYWIVLSSSLEALSPQDDKEVERLLTGVTDLVGNQVDMTDVGQNCKGIPVVPSSPLPSSSSLSPSSFSPFPSSSSTLSTLQPPPTVPPITSVPVIVTCELKNRVQDFDIERYSGSWHDIMIMKTTRPAPPATPACMTHVFAWASNSLAYFEKIYDVRAAQYRTMQGSAQVIGPVSHGLFSIVPRLGQQLTYGIVDTDYDEYAVIIGCLRDDRGPGPALAVARVRVLSRRYWLGAAARERVLGVLRVLGLGSPSEMLELDTRPCLPDACPRRGPAMQDFDARQFAGTWYLVKWLEVPEGPIPECVTYLNAVAVNASMFLQENDARDSFSRKAVLEALPVDRLAGEARYVIQDHPGPPAIHFDVIHAEYNSWALVSICSEPDEKYPDGVAKNSLRVVSRSRDPSKFPEADVAKVLKDHDLDFTTFETIQYSMDACGPVKCPLDIPPMEKFDATRFAGLWVVLEETPSDVTTGFCTRHRISKGRLNQMILDVYQYNSDGESVSNQTYHLDSLVPSEGRFKNTAPPEKEQDIFESYWVLDTDYKEFAVVYSCSDQSGGWENARTWVLGRSTTGLGHASTMRVLDLLANSYVDTRRLREVDNQIAPCPPINDHFIPDNNPPRPGAGSAGCRLVAHGGLLALSAAALVFVGVHARVGLRGLGLTAVSEPAGCSCSPRAESPAASCSPSADSQEGCYAPAAGTLKVQALGRAPAEHTDRVVHILVSDLTG